MSLNRNQTTLCVIGGVFAAGAAVLGWFLMGALNERSDARKIRDESMSEIDRFYSEKVFPSKESLEAVKANTDEFRTWRENARLIASRGDKSFVETTPPSFKQFLQSEQVRLSALPGAADGRICAAGFAFGFDRYLGQNPTMPERNDLPKLQRQLDFIAAAAELFSECGVNELKAVKRDDTPAVAPEEEAPAPRPAKKGKKGKADARDDEPPATSLEYSFQFLASPKALVQVLNRFNSEYRFVVVTELNFSESQDLISENFAIREKAENEAKNGGRSRRRPRRGGEDAEQAAAEQAGKAGGLVIDPEIDAPLAVDMTVKVFDFGKGVAVAEPAQAPVPADEPAAAEAAPAGAAEAAPAENAGEEASK